MALFPDPRRARYDIVAMGEDLRPQTLMEAYRSGIFPWPTDEAPLPWFSPHRRAVLFFDEIHISRSLARTLRAHPFRLTVDVDFPGVIERCAATPRPDQEGTWIFPDIVEAYVRLHELGHAHSAEAWQGEELVGGIYGVDLGGAFGGESMFYLRPDASKLALLHLTDHLRDRGLGWMDIQVMTPHMEVLGAREIARSEFLDLLKETQERGLALFP